MVEGSAPLPLDRTAHPGKDLSAWERHYADRARGCGVFLACEAEFLELVDPPIATDGELITIFGGEPPAIIEARVITRSCR
jgi:hypothetical protein